MGTMCVSVQEAGREKDAMKVITTPEELGLDGDYIRFRQREEE